MIKRIQFMALLVAAGALLAIPAVGQAHHRAGHSKGGKGKSCAQKRTVNKGFTVRGTLVSYTADNPSPGNQTSVKITVTGANRHARVSGELKDTNSNKPGVQVAGGSYTVDSSGDPADLFGVRLSGYEALEIPGEGDKVRIRGKIAVTRKKCAPKGTSLDDRYGKVNIRRVKIIDAD